MKGPPNRGPLKIPMIIVQGALQYKGYSTHGRTMQGRCTDYHDKIHTWSFNTWPLNTQALQYRGSGEWIHGTTLYIYNGLIMVVRRILQWSYNGLTMAVCIGRYRYTYICVYIYIYIYVYISLSLYIYIYIYILHVLHV